MRGVTSLAAALLSLAACAYGDSDDDTDTRATAEDASASSEGAAGDETADGAAGGGCFGGDNCDPLSPDCDDGLVCAPDGAAFSCVPVGDPADAPGPGEACDGAASCQAGLLCLSVAVDGCAGGPGCCVPVCELSAPQCGDAGNCVPFFAQPPPCFDDVGVCLAGG